MGLVHRRPQRVAAAVLLAGFLLARSPYALALNPAVDISQYAHTSWRIDDGFSSGRVTSFAQTSDGYLWLGTEFGLLRFDGVRFTPWRPPQGGSLPAAFIGSLLAGRDGTLWIGTLGGLASWKDGTFRQYAQLAGMSVDSLLEDRQATIWAVGNRTNRSRLCSIRSGSAECHGDDGALGPSVSSLLEDSKGNIWATNLNGVWRWRPGEPQFYSLVGPSGGSFQRLADVGDGLLVVTRKGVSRFVDGKAVNVRFPAAQSPIEPRTLFRDRDGGVWLGTLGGLVHIHQGRTEVFARSDGLSGDRVWRVFEDREGSIWVATLDGIDRFRESAAALFSVSQGLSSSVVGGVLAAHDGAVWISTESGLNRWRDGKLTVYREPRDRRKSTVSTHMMRAPGVREVSERGLAGNLESLFQDARGRLWVATVAGIGYVEGDRFVPIGGVPAGIVTDIAEDTRGNLWFARYDRGLLRLAPNNDSYQISLAELGLTDVVTRLAVDPVPSGLWLGLMRGGVAYYANGRIQHSYSAADGLGQGRVRYLHVDPTGTLWVATEGGLSRFKNGHFATLSSKNGLPCDAVDWMIDDGAGSYWLPMACGIVRVARNDLEAWAAAVDQNRHATIGATVLDGADSVRYASSFYSPHGTKSGDGRLWFVTREGVSIVDPRHLPFNSLPPPVHIEQLTADRRSYDAPSNGAGRLNLPARTRDLQIDYTALSLVSPERVRFRYKLEGRDDDWQDAGARRQAFYTDLPPRDYRFRVIASNNSGVWNEAGTFLDFSVAPAYYQTVWFRVAVFVTTAAVIAALYRMRQRRLALQFNLRMEERVNERTRIARDLHDTLLQSFHGVVLRFQAAALLLPDRPAEARETLETAIDSASQAIVEGRGAVLGRLRPQTSVNNDLAEIMSALGDEFSAADRAPQPAPHFLVRVEGTPCDLATLVRDEVYWIAREALRNAFQHGRATGIEVEIRYDLRQFRLRVRDDGMGIEPAVFADGGRTGHYGLAGMRERAELLGGTVALWSERGAGTEMELRLPGSVAYAKGSR